MLLSAALLSLLALSVAATVPAPAPAHAHAAAVVAVKNKPAVVAAIQHHVNGANSKAAAPALHPHGKDAAGNSTSTPASNLTCVPFDPKDTNCGFMSPAASVLTPNQAASINSSFYDLLAGVCPTVKPFASTLPIVFCLGAMGPCNNASFTLPATDPVTDLPSLPDTVKFYNSVKFAEIVPSLRKLGVKIPCYSLCANVAGAILNCSMIQFNKTADPCAGLPTTNCSDTLGPLPGAASPQTTVSGGDAAATSKSNASSMTTTMPGGAVAGKSGLGVVAVLSGVVAALVLVFA